MSSAWGFSWGSSWGSSWGTVGNFAQPGGYIGGYFSKKKWHTIIGEIRAEKDAKERARLKKLRALSAKKRKQAEQAADQRLADIIALENAGREFARQLAAFNAMQVQRATHQAHQRALEAQMNMIAARLAQEQQDDEEALAFLIGQQ